MKDEFDEVEIEVGLKNEKRKKNQNHSLIRKLKKIEPNASQSKTKKLD